MKRQELEKERENLRTVFRKMFSITEDAASNEEIRDRILSGGKVTGTNMVVMICAILIASVGLNTNSVAVIIGAMLISPLMGSILAIAYGTASNDAYLMKRHSVGFAVQILMSVAAATILFSAVADQRADRTAPGPYQSELFRCDNRLVRWDCRHRRADTTGQIQQHHSRRSYRNSADAAALYLRLCHRKRQSPDAAGRILSVMETTAQKDVPQYIACAAADHSDRSRLEHLRQCRRSFERTTKTLNCFSEPFSVFSFLCL